MCIDLLCGLGWIARRVWWLCFSLTRRWLICCILFVYTDVFDLLYRLWFVVKTCIASRLQYWRSQLSCVTCSVGGALCCCSVNGLSVDILTVSEDLLRRGTLIVALKTEMWLFYPLQILSASADVVRLVQFNCVYVLGMNWWCCTCWKCVWLFADVVWLVELLCLCLCWHVRCVICWNNVFLADVCWLVMLMCVFGKRLYVSLFRYWCYITFGLTCYVCVCAFVAQIIEFVCWNIVIKCWCALTCLVHVMFCCWNFTVSYIKTGCVSANLIGLSFLMAVFVWMWMLYVLNIDLLPDVVC